MYPVVKHVFNYKNVKTSVDFYQLWICIVCIYVMQVTACCFEALENIHSIYNIHVPCANLCFLSQFFPGKAFILSALANEIMREASREICSILWNYR